MYRSLYDSRKDQRKAKRFMNHIIKKVSVGGFVEDCRYHPCIVTEKCFSARDPHGADISVKSLITGTPYGCSLFHCGILVLTKVEAFERVACARDEGWEAYLKKYIGYTDEALVEWRELDKIWGFEKDQPRS